MGVVTAGAGQKPLAVNRRVIFNLLAFYTLSCVHRFSARCAHRPLPQPAFPSTTTPTHPPTHHTRKGRQKWRFKQHEREQKTTTNCAEVFVLNRIVRAKSFVIAEDARMHPISRLLSPETPCLRHCCEENCRPLFLEPETGIFGTNTTKRAVFGLSFKSNRIRRIWIR